MKVRKLTEVMQEYPDFKPGWLGEKNGGLSNPRFGSVERVVICDDDGKPIFDQYEIAEKGGAIVVPWYCGERQLFVGLISLIRPVIADPITGSQGGVVSIETPRGFGIGIETEGETGIRELGEETQLVVRKLELIGITNPNTAFYKNTGIPIFAAEIDRKKFSERRPDATERILKCEFYTKEKVAALSKEQKIFCGLTKAALGDFFLYY